MNESPIGVIGLGLLGRGIVASLIAQRRPVIAVARDPEENAAALPIQERMLDELVDRDELSPSDLATWHERLTRTTTLEPLRDVSFVIESVTEDFAIKQRVFDELERVVRPDTVIASNTSAIPISVLQQTRRHPERFVGMHWAEPAHATRFLEIIRGEATSDETIARTADLARQLGKDPTVCRKDIPGFVVNRIAYAMYREALHLVEEGVADVETIDRPPSDRLPRRRWQAGDRQWPGVLRLHRRRSS